MKGREKKKREKKRKERKRKEKVQVIPFCPANY